MASARGTGDALTVNPRARRSAGGFTLVELMVVVAIIGTIGAMGALLVRRALNANKAPSFARNFLSMVHETRHAAFANGRATRLTIDTTVTPMVIYSEILDPSDANKSTWLPNGKTTLPAMVQFCQPTASVVQIAASPTCPITTTMNRRVCFAPNGRVNLTTDSVACPGTGSSTATTPSSGTGATLYFRGTQESNNDVTYKIMIWGLTGLPRMADQW
jgi:prepilin-type N-terminal cleavage/methylation domain-containing protein